jgi:hypothetical protein
VLLGKEFLAFRTIIVLSTSGLSSSRRITAQDSRMYYRHRLIVTRVTYDHLRQRINGGVGRGLGEQAARWNGLKYFPARLFLLDCLTLNMKALLQQTTCPTTQCHILKT